jgi:RHS repeat-associated protein
LTGSACNFNGLRSSPIVDNIDGVIYLNTCSDLRAINLDGFLKWSFTKDNANYWDGGTYWPTGTSPVICNNDVIYVGSLYHDEDDPQNGVFHAIHSEGSLYWKLPARWDYSSSTGVAATRSGFVIFDWSDEGGATLASRSLDGSSTLFSYGQWASQIAVGDDDTVYAMFTHHMVAFGKWSRWLTYPEIFYGGISIGDDGTIYVCRQPYSVLMALSPTDGSTLWELQLSDNPAAQWYYVMCNPAIGWDGTIYIKNIDGELCAISQQGELKWKRSIGGMWSYQWGSGSCAPVVDINNTIVVYGDNGIVYRFDSNGNELSRCAVGEGLQSQIAVGSDGTVYVCGAGSGAGNLYALKSFSIEKVAKLDPDQRRDSMWSDPVDTGTGGHYIKRTLLTVDGAQPVSFDVSYNSQLLNQGPMGKGWGHNFETHVKELPNGDIDFYWNANRVNRFVYNGTGTYSSPDLATRYDTLIKNADGSYALKRKDQSIYEFNSAGRLLQIKNKHGQAITLAYDADGRLTTITEAVSGRSLALQYNAGGLVSAAVDPLGRQVTFTYDANHNLTRITDAAGYSTDYTYDAAGNITAEQPATAEQSFTTPDAAITTAADNRIATYNGQPVEYDADGNMTHGPLNGTMADFTFDARGRLTAAGDTSYTYDAEGNRISVTENGARTDYIINPEAPLSQVLVKTDAQGNQTYYIYGLGLIAQEENGAYRTHHYDLRGSTVAITDENGAVTDRFQYDPYGKVVHRSSSTSTYFLFNGRDGVITDENGLLYMRARYYNPEIRRFLSKDPVRSSIVNPQSLDAYGYCENDPISKVDPSGEIVETFLDIASIGYSAYELIKDPCLKNLGFVFWDVGATVLPFVPGSYVTRGSKVIVKAITKEKRVAGAAKAAEKAGAEFLSKSWDKGTFPNRMQSIRYHWEKHGKPFGKSIDEYTQDALEFYKQNKSRAIHITLKDGRPGLKIKGAPGGIFTPEGRVISFWYE